MHTVGEDGTCNAMPRSVNSVTNSSLFMNITCITGQRLFGTQDSEVIFQIITDTLAITSLYYNKMDDKTYGRKQYFTASIYNRGTILIFRL